MSKPGHRFVLGAPALMAFIAFMTPWTAPLNRELDPESTLIAAEAAHPPFGALANSQSASQANAAGEVRPDNVTPKVSSSNVCDVRAFGAQGDGVHVDIPAIQGAIQACGDQGGGIVRMGPGTYLSGSIQLRSNITLQLEQGAHLLGSSDLGQYTSIGRAAEKRSTALIWAIGARNVGISGAGVIDGNGRAFIAEGKQHTGLPFYDPKLTRQGAEAFSRYEQNREGPTEMRDRPGCWFCSSNARTSSFMGSGWLTHPTGAFTSPVAGTP